MVDRKESLFTSLEEPWRQLSHNPQLSSADGVLPASSTACRSRYGTRGLHRVVIATNTASADK